MALTTVQPDMVRYKMTMVQGQDPHVREQKQPGAFGRFLSGMGKILGAVAMPLSFFCPPAAIGAAGMYGLGMVGDGMQQRAYGRAAEKAARDSVTNVSFPGLGVMQGSPIQPAAGSFGARDSMIMQVLDARGSSVFDMSNTIAK